MQSLQQTISSIVRDVLATSRLTEQQEQQINTMLWCQQFSADDFAALDHLIEALEAHKIQVSFGSQSQAA